MKGWILARGRYDDGGYPGASLDRPALQSPLDVVRQRQIDVIAVYKVDRLTRSLADFAKLIELLDAHDVSFISITRSFNTTTSMGRLTLNMLLSFAQFEREVTGERIRDKIAASKKKGLWVGGVVPLGCKVVDRKLMIDEAEAPIVRLIFERYCARGSLIALMRELREREVVTRLRTLSSGRKIGGIAFTKGPLAYLLKNRMYLGEINHGQSSYPGEHPAIVDKAVFDKAQETLVRNAAAKGYSQSRSQALCRAALRRPWPSNDPELRNETPGPLSLLRLEGSHGRSERPCRSNCEGFCPRCRGGGSRHASQAGLHRGSETLDKPSRSSAACGR